MENHKNNNSNVTLRKAHKLLRKIVKKLGRKDLHFSAIISVSASRPGDIVTYGAHIDAPRDGLAPLTFGAVDKDEFLGYLKDFLDNKIDEDDVERAWHEAQIKENERSTDYHQAQIDKIDNPKPEEAEIVDESEPDDNAVEKSAE